VCYALHLRCARYVIAELIETETDYVKDLGLLVEVSDSDALYCSLVSDYMP